jgi:hypothetical protein
MYYLECAKFTQNRSLSQLKVQLQKYSTAITAIQKVCRQVRGSLDSAVSIATGYGLDGRGIRVRILVGQEFSLLHVGLWDPSSLQSNGYQG